MNAKGVSTAKPIFLNFLVHSIFMKSVICI
jgi:hypothetical protein